MERFEKKFKEFINEEKEGSFYDAGSLLEYLIDYKSELSDYIGVDAMEQDFAKFAANELKEPGAEEFDPEFYTFEVINKRYPQIVDKFFKTPNQGRNWLWLSAMDLLSNGFFGENNDSNLYYHKYDDNRADNKWKNWYEDYGKKVSISDADEMAYLFASWAGKDTDTEDISEELEQAYKLSYPLEVEKSYGMHSYSDQADFPVITATAGNLFYEDEDDPQNKYMEAYRDDSFRSESKPFNPRANMFDIFRGPNEAIDKFLSKFAY